jgi:hypothetical protein
MNCPVNIRSLTVKLGNFNCTFSFIEHTPDSRYFDDRTRAGTGPDRTGSDYQPAGKKPEIHRLKLLKNVLF